MSENKNVPSKNPLLIRRKKVAKELEEIIRAEGLGGSLFDCGLIVSHAVV